jgi:hypothetical protein
MSIYPHDSALNLGANTRYQARDYLLPRQGCTLTYYCYGSWITGSLLLFCVIHLTVMSPSQEQQRSSKVKGFLRNVFRPKSRKLVSSSQHSRANDSRPNADSSRLTSTSPGKVSSDMDLVLKTYNASTLKSILGPTGPGKCFEYIISVRFYYPDVITFTFTPAGPTPTADPTHNHGQGSTAKRSLLFAWHGVEQLLKKIEPCVSGTPAKVPFTVLNIIIDIWKVCSHLSESRCED